MRTRKNPTVREVTAQVVGVLKRADLTFHKPATRRTPMIEGVEVSGNIRRGAVCVVAWSKSDERARAAYQAAKDAVLAEGWRMMFDNPMGATFCVAPPRPEDTKTNPYRRNSSDEPRVGDQWSWGEHTREIAAIQERNGERLIYVRESDRPGVLAIYGAEEFPAHKAREMAQHAKWEARRPEREREQRERAEREARDAARREEAEAAERSLVARLRAFATYERLTEKQKEKMKVDFRNQVQYKGKVYTIAGLIEEKIKVDGWRVDEDGIDGPGGAFIAKKSLTALGLRYARYLWHKEHPPAPEPRMTKEQRELMNELFGVSKPKRR
jgi:hypothetical protein